MTIRKPRADECVRPYINLLAAAAGAAAAHAAVAAAVAGHDAAAEAAGGCVSEVDDARQRVGGMNRTSDLGLRTSGWRAFKSCGAFRLRSEGCGPRSEVLEQQLLL